MIAISAIIFLNIAAFVMSESVFYDIRRIAEYTAIDVEWFYPCDFDFLPQSKRDFNGKNVFTFYPSEFMVRT